MKLNTDEIFGTKGCKINLYPFQATCTTWMRCIEYNVGDPRFMAGGILANDMGMGKTPTMSVLVAANPVPATLILTTPSTRYEWIKMFILCNIDVTIYTIDSGVIYKCSMVKDDKGIYVLTQDALSKKRGEQFIEPAIMVCNYQLITNGTVNNKIVTNQNWDRIIVDEGAFLRTQNDSWSKLDALAQPIRDTPSGPVRVGSRWCITGTPIQNGGKSDLVNIFRWVDGRFLRGKTEREWNDELQVLTATNLFRINRSQVTNMMKTLMEYPDKDPVVTYHKFDLERSRYSDWLESVDYENMVNFCSNFNNNGPNSGDARILMEKILTDERCFMIAKTTESKYINRNRQGGSFLETTEFRSMISYPYATVPNFISTFLGNSAVYRGPMCKIDKLRKMMETGESFVCFHHFDGIGLEIKRFCEDKFGNYVVLTISGAVKSDLDRHNIVERANLLIDSGFSVVLVSSTKATAEGMNYQKFNHIIMFDHEYNQKTDEQAKARVQRIGQKKQVYIHEFILMDFNTFYGPVSVDEHILEVCKSREHLSDVIDLYNAAFTFRRYTYPYINPSTGQTTNESGVYFGDYWEIQMKGMIGGVDTVGPQWIH